jgi:hypothetical protein
MKLTRMNCCLASFCLFGFLMAGGVASAQTETVCFQWSQVVGVDGTIDVDASLSQGDIRSYSWAWGDNSLQLPSTNPRASKAYTLPPPYDRTVTLFIDYHSGNIGTASCDTFPWIHVFHPEPTGGHCCGTVCGPDQC